MFSSKSLIVLSIFSIFASSADYTNLVFKGCANQNFQNFNDFYRQSLKSLIDTLISQSSTVRFYKTTPGEGSLNGLFQCRGDLSNNDCNRCVKGAQSMAHRLCGRAVAVRVQLNGCYFRYEISGFRQTNGTEFLYKVCGSTQPNGAGFGDRVELALGEIVKGLESGNNGGFYAGGYQSVYVLGQCEGDLGTGDCVNCVKNALDRAKSDCGYSISAQIYLQECYISYTYYPNGVPRNQNSLPPSSGSGMSTQKTVAIMLGGLVGVGLMMSCLLFTKSVFKKKTYTYKYGG